MSSIVSHLGIECSAVAADTVDQAVEGFATNGRWPENVPPDEIFVEELGGVTSEVRFVPSIRGLVVSSYWPVLEASFEYLWANLRKLAGSRSRSDTARIEFDLERDDWEILLVYQTCFRHGWFGRTLSCDDGNPHKWLISAPHFIRRCTPFKDMGSLLHNVPEASILFEPTCVEDDNVVRRHADIRSKDRERMLREIQGELRVPFVPPRHAPEWMSHIVEEYVCEADLALRSGAAFPAIVLYAAALEALLAILYRFDELPEETPAAVSRDQLWDVFVMRELVDEVRDDGRFSEEIVVAINELRNLRNGVHANQYSEAVALVGIGDALDARSTIRYVANFVEKCEQIGPDD